MAAQILKPAIYVPERVMSIKDARNRADNADEIINDKKAELLALVMGNPKDLTPCDEDPFSYMKEKFDEIIEYLSTGIIDNYIYTMCADDAEYSSGSLVKKAFDEIKRDNEKMLEEERKRSQFFCENTALHSYNFDDNNIYEYYKDSRGVKIEFPITTEEQRKAALMKIKEYDNNLLKQLCSKNNSESLK